MEEIFDLGGSTRPIEIRGTGIVLRAPGLRGRGVYRGKRTEGEVRAAAEVPEPDPIDAGIAEIGLEMHDFEIDAPTPVVVRPAGVRAGEGALQDDEIEIEFRCARDQYHYAIYRDEDGVVSIHFPKRVPPGQALITRAPADEAPYVYRIQLRPVLGVAPEGVTTRGWGGFLKKAFKVVVGKLAGPVVGLAAYCAVWTWEKLARKHEGFHGGKDVGKLLADKPITFDDWRALSGQRALLFIHGTTSCTSGAFSELRNFGPAAQQLYGAYGGRVLGFNHHTLTKGVSRNVVEFYRALRKGAGPFEFDIICHSRGGLVARALKELSPEDIARLSGEGSWQPSARVSVRRIVFVGTPNNGTRLADPSNIPKALDRLANVATLVPGAGMAIGGVLAWAAYIAEAGLKALPGLRDQAPGSDLLLTLNSPAPAAGPVVTGDYFAVQSDYEPQGSLVKAILDAGVDRLFGNEPNDLVVPTLGVSRIDESDLDAARVKYFGETQGDNVAHTRFFKETGTWDHILASLQL